MQKHHVTFMRWAALVAILAAADRSLGMGAVARLESVFLDSWHSPQTQGHGLGWLIGGQLLCIAAVLGGWHLTRQNGLRPWAPGRRPCLAALARVAVAQGASTKMLAAIYSDTFTPGLSEQDAQIALSRFGHGPRDETLELIKTLGRRDRTRLVCAALTLLRMRADATGQGLTELDHLTEAMGLDGDSIAKSWDRSQGQDGWRHTARAMLHDQMAKHARQFAPVARGVAQLRAHSGRGGQALARLARQIGLIAAKSFIRAVAPPNRPAQDDQLSGLRRRLKRRNALGRSLQNIDVQGFRRGMP